MKSVMVAHTIYTGILGGKGRDIAMNLRYYLHTYQDSIFKKSKKNEITKKLQKGRADENTWRDWHEQKGRQEL